MQYRPEIDGLRAVAVLPVILFHAGFSLFSGGYVGVDVFFVISGYLITNILVSELEQGNFSILCFYERRARRILPALFFVMLACLPFAYMWMIPSQLEEFAQSIFAVSLFLSNWLFWTQTGYFGTAAELKPLLHTWSLAVEEQYYMLFPILLLSLWRYGRRSILGFVVVVALLSLLLSEWGWRNEPDINFFFTFSRFWELLAGSICAFLTVGRTLKSNNFLSAIGLAAIVFAIFVFDENTPFPSVYALVPVVGTALIILFGRQGSWVANLLSMRAFVGIGLISYSAYLWHQPLFAFARIRSPTEPSHILMAGLAVAALLLAWATWRYVEQPFRKRADPVLVTRRSVFAASGAVSAVFVAVGLAGHVGNGFEFRLNDFEREIIAKSAAFNFTCHPNPNCQLGDINGINSEIAFIGDSHMWRYAYLLNEYFSAQNLNATLLVWAWCAPLLDYSSEVVSRCGGADGRAFRDEFAKALNDTQIKTFVLAAEWANYTTGYRYNSAPIYYDFERDGVENFDVLNNPNEFSSSLKHTIDELVSRGKNVLIVGPVPEYQFDVPEAALRSSISGKELDYFALLRSEYERRNQEVFSAFAENSDRATLLDVWPLMCTDISCSPFSDEGFPLYTDHNHLSPQGMEPIIMKLISLFPHLISNSY